MPKFLRSNAGAPTAALTVAHAIFSFVY